MLCKNKKKQKGRENFKEYHFSYLTGKETCNENYFDVFCCSTQELYNHKESECDVYFTNAVWTVCDTQRQAQKGCQ